MGYGEEGGRGMERDRWTKLNIGSTNILVPDVRLPAVLHLRLESVVIPLEFYIELESMLHITDGTLHW